MKLNIALADDHQMVRKGIKSLLESNTKFKVVLEASNGQQLLEEMGELSTLPDIALIDISMPVMDGFETISMMGQTFKEVKCIALSMHNDFNTVFKTINSGAKAYLLKDSHVELLHTTIQTVFEKGTCYDSFVVDSIMEHQNNQTKVKSNKVLSEISAREFEFLNLCCSELAYKEIAHRMNVSPRTVDGYREALFDKLDIHSRVGLVLYAIRHEIYKP